MTKPTPSITSHLHKTARVLALLAATVLTPLATGGFAEDDDLAPVTVSKPIDTGLTLIPTAAGQATVIAATSASSPVAAPGTDLKAVLKSTRLFMPQVSIARAKWEASRADITARQGAFDTQILVDYYGRATGFYGGQALESRVSRRLENYGAEFYGGYRVSSGRYPIYEDEYITNDLGEFKVGGRVNLLKDRKTDKERTDLANARLGAEAARHAFNAEMIDLNGNAAGAYVNWLYWERVLTVYEDLLRIAKDRQKAISRSIDAGQLSAITLDENQQIILQREAALLTARQGLIAAEAELALYFRSADGQPAIAVYGQSSRMPSIDPFAAETPDEWVARLIEERPDIRALRTEAKQLENSLALARNDKQASLDLGYEISRDFGSGSETRRGTDNILQLTFKVPFELSAARGAERKAAAQIRGLDAQARLIADQIRLALFANAQQLTAAREQMVLTEQAIAVAERLRQAEETRYLAGASNFFRLNTQESVLADNRLAAIGAQRSFDRSLVAFLRLTGELPGVLIESAE